MANRKKTQTATVQDSSASDPNHGRTKVLPGSELDSVVRYLRNSDIAQVRQFRGVCREVLGTLGIDSNGRAAAGATPEAGSDQVDLQSLYTWMRSLTVEDVEAVEQVVLLEATAGGRG